MSGKKMKRLRKRVKGIMDKNKVDDKLFKGKMKIAKKAFKMGAITACIVLMALPAFSDKLIIPFDCYPKEIQVSFAEAGRKLDLSGNDRTRESWGFIVNEGSQFTIYTYKSATPEDFKIMMDIFQGSA